MRAIVATLAQSVGGIALRLRLPAAPAVYATAATRAERGGNGMGNLAVGGAEEEADLEVRPTVG
ncbi:MAG: hypothetical protein ACYC6N_27735 [Pirellulaceae bacterium]